MAERVVAPRVLFAMGAAALVGVVAVALVQRGVVVSGERFPLLMGALAAGGLVYLALRVSLAWTFSAAIGLSIFSGQASELGLPIGLDRLALGFGLVLLVARTRSSNDRDARATPRFTALHALLAIAALYAIVSAAWAGTLLEHDGLFGLLDRFGVIPFLMFALAPRIFATDRDREALLATLVGVGAYLGLLALAESLGLDELVLPRYIADEDVGIHFGRARGPFVEAVANGLALFACGVAAATGLARWRRPEARLIAGTALVLVALGVVLTLTRAVWLASAIAPVVAMLCSARLRRYVLPAVAAGAVVVGATLTFVPGLSDKADARTLEQQPVWDRLNTNAAAVQMIRERPLLGYGWNAYIDEGTEHLRQIGDFPLTGAGLNVHNVPLSHATELGLVGFALWLAAFLAAIAGGALRRTSAALEPWRLGLIALALNWIIVANFGPLGYAFPTLLLWTWAGIVATGRQAR